MVAPRGAGRVDVRGWGELGDAVGGDADLPVIAVDDRVVMSTQQHTVVEAGDAAVDEGDDVMAVAPRRR